MTQNEIEWRYSDANENWTKFNAANGKLHDQITELARKTYIGGFLYSPRSI